MGKSATGRAAARLDGCCSYLQADIGPDSDTPILPFCLAFSTRDECSSLSPAMPPSFTSSFAVC